MNTPELIYQTITFFFSGLWLYMGLLLLILVIRGDITRAINSTKDFIKKVIARYTEKKDREAKFKNFRSSKSPAQWKE